MSCGNASLVNLTQQVLYHPLQPTAQCSIPTCCTQERTDTLTVEWDCNTDAVIDITAITRTHKIAKIDDGVITMGTTAAIQSQKGFITCSCSNDGCHPIKVLNKFEVSSDVVTEATSCLAPAYLHEIHDYPPVIVIKDKVCMSSIVVKGMAKETKLYYDCNCCKITQQYFTYEGINYTILGQDIDGTGCYIVVDKPLVVDINAAVKLSERQLVMIARPNGCTYKFTIPRSAMEGWTSPTNFQIMYPGTVSDSINGVLICKKDTTLTPHKPYSPCGICNDQPANLNLQTGYHSGH